MIKFGVTVTERPMSAAEMVKQIRFGTALGLTNAAKEGQKVVMAALGDKFTLRGQWFKQSMKYGIKVKMAKPSNLASAVHTAADWLLLHEEGGDKRPQGRSLAVPTDNVRRNKRLIIPRGQRPKGLKDKRTFVLNTKNGRVLFQRKYKGKRSKIVALYNLEPKVRVPKRATFFEPIGDVVKRHLHHHIISGIEKAFATGGRRRGRIGSYNTR